MPTDSTNRKRIQRHYDRLATNGPYATLAPHNRGGRKGQYVAEVFSAVMRDALGKQDLSNAQILDFGSGTGLQAAALAGEARLFHGVDISDGMLQQARELCRDIPRTSFSKIDGKHLPFPDGTFDFVLTRETLCHVSDSDIQDLLREICRVMKKDGKLIWIDQVSTNNAWQKHPKAPDVIKRDPRAIISHGGHAGFALKIDRIIRTPRFPFVFIAWLGLIPRGWIPKFARFEVFVHRHLPLFMEKRRWWDHLFVFEAKQ